MLTPDQKFEKNIIQPVICNQIGEAHGPLDYKRCSTMHDECLLTSGLYYSSMRSPRLPILHPYNPEFAVPKFPIVLGLDPGTNHELIDLLRIKFALPNISVQQFLIMQTNPWTKDKLLYRPHSWLHGSAPEFSTAYSQSAALNVTFFNSDNTVNELKEQGIVTHFDGSLHGSPIVASPSNMELAEYCNDHHTNFLYSLCFDPSSNKAILILHVILNITDEMRLTEAINKLPSKPNVGQWLNKLIDTDFNHRVLGEIRNFFKGYNPLIPAPPKPMIFSKTTGATASALEEWEASENKEEISKAMHSFFNMHIQPSTQQKEQQQTISLSDQTEDDNSMIDEDEEVATLSVGAKNSMS